MKTVTQKTKAWMTQHCIATPEEIMNGGLTNLAFHTRDMKSAGWTYAGEAEITVHIVDEKSLIDNKVEALRAEAANIRAEATAKVTRIESQIQQLLAIEYRPS